MPLTGDVDRRRSTDPATGADPSADVLKLPHDGSRRQDPAFFAAHRGLGSPSPAWARTTRTATLPRAPFGSATGLGMTVLRTDQQGSVAVTEHDGRLGAGYLAVNVPKPVGQQRPGGWPAPDRCKRAAPLPPCAGATPRRPMLGTDLAPSSAAYPSGD